MKQLVAHNRFPDRFSSDIRHMEFPWVKVEDRPWANGRFKCLEFYNLVGFHVRLADDSDQALCHIQLWTAGLGVSAGFHNHTGEVFCEIHACIVNGTGKGGMYWATVPDDDFDVPNPKPGTYNGIVVGDMSEHGPLWRTVRDGIPERRINGTVDYPWHAWLAGEGRPGAQQSYDVWAAFEFTPVLANTSSEQAAKPAAGTYKLTNEAYGDSAIIKDGNSTDGALILSQRTGGANTWEVAYVVGTQTITLKNIVSGSFAMSSWPPVDGQHLVGSRYAAVLGITSSWIVSAVQTNYYIIWLMGTELVWAQDTDGNVVLKKYVPSETSQHWQFTKG